jgi:hypothetical protein
MSTKKSLVIAGLSLLVAAVLSAQSVTDLAKKERERRAAVKNKPASIITNADLAKAKRQPAVQVSGAEQAAADEQAGEKPGAGAPAGQVEAGDKAAAAKEAQKAAADQTAMAEKDFKARLSELAQKAKDAQDMIDLLTLKMNSLWQEYYNLSDVKTREYTQFQISETYDKLTRAELDAKRATQDLDDFLATAKREGVPQIWIK